jgi:hypothetical protein
VIIGRREREREREKKGITPPLVPFLSLLLLLLFPFLLEEEEGRT